MEGIKRMKDIGENNFWLIFWSIISITLISIVYLGVSNQYNYRKDMLESGYVLETVPSTYKEIWVKK